MTALYVIRLAEHHPPGKGYTGQDTATCDWTAPDGVPHTYSATSRHGASMALARALQRAGAPDGPWVGVDAQSGAKRLQGRSLHALAALSIREGEHDGPTLTKWVPYAGPGRTEEP